eukprot:2858484-Karenia_brevis.AAC.1
MDSIKDDPAKIAEANGNLRADHIADRARSEFFNPNVVQLANLLCQRVVDYTDFMKGVHSIIA